MRIDKLLQCCHAYRHPLKICALLQAVLDHPYCDSILTRQKNLISCDQSLLVSAKGETNCQLWL